jgi:hypothetical protein
MQADCYYIQNSDSVSLAAATVKKRADASDASPKSSQQEETPEPYLGAVAAASTDVWRHRSIGTVHGAGGKARPVLLVRKIASSMRFISFAMSHCEASNPGCGFARRAIGPFGCPRHPEALPQRPQI